MLQSSVLKVYDAEKEADLTESRAKVRANEIIENAKKQSAENSAKMQSAALKESESRLENARQRGDALILSMVENAKSQISAMHQSTINKQDNAIEEIIKSLL